jgi:DNA helicase HerA-like ATPase
MMIAPDGRGAVSVLVADALLQRPRLYSAFLLYLLAQLFEALPEVGDLEKPKLVFFFDEAHLLFKELPSSLLEKIELVVRLIRSRGVGLYFISQNPSDIPDSVLGQLSHRVQHALRAYTPKDQKSVKAAADAFRPNPAFDTATAISELQVGEALVSFLDEAGAPLPVQRAWVIPPRSRVGSITDPERQAVLAGSPVGERYDLAVDRESAFERLARPAPTPATPPAVPAGSGAWQRGALPSRPGLPQPSPIQATPGSSGPGLAEQIFFGTSRRQGVAEAMAKSVARSVGSQVGRSLVRGLLGSWLR